MLNLTIENIVYSDTGATFDVVAKADSAHSFDTYGLKLYAAELWQVDKLTFTETNLLTGFTQFDTNLNNEISEVDGTGRGPGSNTVGFHAWGVGGPKSMLRGESVTLARFTFTMSSRWESESEIVLDFCVADPGMDTGFARLGNSIPYGTTSRVFRKDSPPPPPPPTPTLVEVLAVFRDASGKLFLRFNGQMVPINP